MGKRKRNNKVRVKVYKQPRLEVFDRFGNSYGKLNELELLDLRCQIKRHSITGFYVYQDAEKIFIQSDGFFSKHIRAFDTDIEMRNYLLGIDNNLYKEEINGRV